LKCESCDPIKISTSTLDSGTGSDAVSADDGSCGLRRVPHTGCLKIREFRIQSVVRKDPVELEKYLEKKFALPEEDISTLIVQYIAAFISTVTKYVLF
jgi:hypothetical protein